MEYIELAFGVIILVLLGSFGVFIFNYEYTWGYERIVIKDKWVKYESGTAKYLVSSEDNEVYEITDTLILNRWDSSNMYAKLEIGQTYDIKTQGWRFPLLSMYKNILKAELRVLGDKNE